MKNKTLKKSLVGIMIFSMVAMYGYMPVSQAASMTDSSDLITDSEAGATGVTHTITFTTGVALINADDIITFTFEGATNLVSGGATCPGTMVASGADPTIICTGTLAAGTDSLVLPATINPAVGSYKVDIVSSTVGGASEYEKAQVRFYIIDDITMYAHVEPTLEFTVDGLDTDDVLNGAIVCQATTTATTTDFGTLVPNVSKTICQELTVTTNATGGFTVTVEQDNELENTTGDNINSFNNALDGTGSSTATAWVIPTGVLDQDHTYGHMGITSNDTDLSVGTGYEDLYSGLGTPQYVGFEAALAQEVMHHDGPADGSTQDKGLIRVGYTAEINALQQAGDYTNTLTYIATATY